VLGVGGSPEAGARVYVRLDAETLTSLIGPAVVTDGAGRFVMSVVAGYRYRLTAEGYEDGRYVSRAEPAAVETTAAPKPVTLQLRRLSPTRSTKLASGGDRPI
jgi:hypothetical protein